MNKQIIIDGVDVNALYSDQIACMNRYEVARLFIKTVEQLQAKEQECEELKIYIESNEQQVKEVETLVMDNDRLINELDQLKAENDTYKKMLEDEDVQLALTEIRSGERHIWYNKANKLSKTLTQIKEIAEKQCVCGVDCIDMKQILQKISEVNDESYLDNHWLYKN